jgi:cytochrome c oxidase cbb3-type subunit 3
MPKTDAPLLPGHDGIQEYDNPIPAWMSWILGLTIVWGGFYILYYVLGDGPSAISDYDASVAENARLQFAEMGVLKSDEPTMLRCMSDPELIAFGKSVFRAQCQSCHGPTGLGLVGPNLCDDAWKNVKRLDDIPKVVAQGAANGAMPAWAARLHPNEVVLVAAYVASLRGSGSGGKQPEGEVIPPWPPVPVRQETKK